MDESLRQAALAQLYATVDSARAVFRGLVVVGHRDSLLSGEMYWSLPGRTKAHGSTLVRQDQNFQVMNAPSPARLAEQLSIVKQLEAAA